MLHKLLISIIPLVKLAFCLMTLSLILYVVAIGIILYLLITRVRALRANPQFTRSPFAGLFFEVRVREALWLISAKISLALTSILFQYGLTYFILFSSILLILFFMCTSRVFLDFLFNLEQFLLSFAHQISLASARASQKSCTRTCSYPMHTAFGFSGIRFFSSYVRNHLSTAGRANQQSAKKVFKNFSAASPPPPPLFYWYRKRL